MAHGTPTVDKAIMVYGTNSRDMHGGMACQVVGWVGVEIRWYLLVMAKCAMIGGW